MNGPLRRYSELIRLNTFLERYEYLRIAGVVGESTFGFDRYLNQLLYTSDRWRKLRQKIILRDNGCDLAMPGYDIKYGIMIHHMNPITIKDVETVSEDIFNPENLVCVSHRTHNAIHYGNESQLPSGSIDRRPNDTCPWR